MMKKEKKEEKKKNEGRERGWESKRDRGERMGS